jgi:hypothetical protein
MSGKIYEWDVVRDKLFGTEKFRWIYRDRIDYIKLITDNEEQADLPCEVIVAPKSIDDSADQGNFFQNFTFSLTDIEDDTMKPKTFLEIPNRTLTFRTIMQAGKSGIHANQLSQNLGLSGKYIYKELKYLTSPAVGVVSVASRVGKSFVYKLYGPGFYSESNKSVKTKKAKIDESETSVEDSSEDHRMHTFLSQKRMKWIEDIVSSEKAILEQHLMQIIRKR